MKSHLKVLYFKVSEPDTELGGTLQSVNGKIMLLASDGQVISNCIPAAAMNLKPGESFKTFNLTLKLPSFSGANTKSSAVSLVEYDIMYTKDKSKKVKRWVDGYLKYNEADRLAIFYDEDGKELMKKVMENGKVREGGMLDTAHWLIEITARRINAVQGDVTKPLIKNHTLPNINNNNNNRPTTKAQVVEHRIEPKEGKKENEGNIVEWNVVYTEDKHKKLKKKWLDGKMSYNATTGDARFFDDEQGAAIFYRKLTPNQVYEGAELDSGRYQFVINEPTTKNVTSTQLSTQQQPKLSTFKRAELPNIEPTVKRTFKVREDIDQKIADNAKKLKRLNYTLPPKKEVKFVLDVEAGEEEPASPIPFNTDAPPQAAYSGFTSGKEVLLSSGKENLKGENLEKENLKRNEMDDEDDDLMALLGDGKPTSKSLFN